MAKIEVSKKVSLLGSWHEDVFSDEIVKSIASRAKTEKGKKMKVVLSETGFKLTRSRFLQESKSTFFPTKDLKTVTRSPEVLQCVLFILSDPERKYKIIAIRCANDGDAVELINISAQIKRKLQSTNVELKKRENGNWTLRETRGHSAIRTVTDVFSDIKPNGEVIPSANGNVVQRSGPIDNGNLVHLSGPIGNDRHASVGHHRGVYIKRGNAGGSSSYRAPRKRADGYISSDGAREFVIQTEVISDPYTTNEVYKRQNSNDITTLKSSGRHASQKDYMDGSRRQEPSRPQMVYGQPVLPSRGVTYSATTSRNVVPSQPVYYYREPLRSHESRMEPPTIVNRPPLAQHWRSATQPQFVPVKVMGDNLNGKFDQRSVRSNSSKISHSHKKRSSESHFATTIPRAIEDMYPRPTVIFRPGPDQIMGFRSRPTMYRVMGPRELIMYPDDGVDIGTPI